MNALAAASTVTLLCAATIYLFSYRLYRSRAFVYVGLAWLANAAYIIVESLVVPGRAGALPIIYAYLASIPTTVLFHLAAIELSSDERQSPLEQLMSVIVPLVVVTAGLAVGGFAWRSSPASAQSVRFIVLVGPGVIYSTVVLAMLAFRFRVQDELELLSFFRGTYVPHTDEILTLGREIDEYMKSRPELLDGPRRKLGIAKRCLVGSLGVYALIQLIYLIRPSIEDTVWIQIPFWIGLVCKLTNMLGVAFLILADAEQVTHAVTVRSVDEQLFALTASIEHDIRNPASILQKRVESLRRRYQHDSIVVSATTSIRQQLDRILAAASVIPTIREDRKFYDERVKIWNAVDLANVAAKSARSEWDKSNIRMTIRHNKAVIRVSAYRERLLQALVNIIKNGIEACLEKTNGESAAISVTVNSNETHAVMTIRDEGVGIPEDVRSQITQPLFSTKNNKPNRGIGLFMAARIIQQHSGELYFDSDGQSFTEVTVSLPLIGASER